MAHYVDKSTQTVIEGLAREDAARPAALCLTSHRLPHTDTTTPPDDECAYDKLKPPPEGTPAISRIDPNGNMAPTQLLQRKQRPRLVARISMPPAEFDSENPLSPPPTEAVMSPLPAANTLHAGHTPIIPRALSPMGNHDEPSGPSTPDQEEALSGPLTLPPQPGDGAEDTIPLHVLTEELERIRLEQERAAKQDEAPTERKPSAEVPRSRKGSSEAGAVDGVILKKPKMNMGAPLGQA